MKRPLAAALLSLGMVGSVAAGPARALNDLQAEVSAAERAFARSMADRDLSAFGQHLSAQAVFFAGAGQVLRGKAAVIAGWAGYFQGPQAPFSWDPDQVEVLPDGSLAHSSGLVRNQAGEPVARFNSVWRQESPGVWRVVFDKGSPLPRN